MGKKRASQSEKFQENSLEKNAVEFSRRNSDIDRFDDEDITDSDDQFSDNEKNILDKIRKKRVPEEVDSDDEVYGLNLNDEDSMESDIERPQDNNDDDDGMPDERAWGKKKGLFYSTDYVDQDYATTNEKERAKAQQEENAARLIQQKIAGELDDADFDFDQFIGKKNDDEKGINDDNDDVVVKMDLSKLSKREKQALMQKESPEFQSLLNDFKDRSKEVNEIIKPFLELMKTNEYPTTPATSFIKVKYQLVLNYLTNILFYLMLKANKTPITNHPVIKRLSEYRHLITQLENSQGDILDKVSDILAAEREGKPIYIVTDSEIKSDVKMAPLKYIKNVEEFDEELDENEETMQVDDEQEEMSDQKRMITYQIAKNKGLTPHRKKELRNPRVKHRNKYRKAQIRRKGAIRQVRKETTRYAGELSGIKASVTKSIKLK